jgi:hypothetical protein
MVVVIAGMHRSGTSMISRLLNLCGVYLGEEKDLIPGAEDNPEGFWENIKFQAINEEILSAFGGSWDFPPSLVDGWEESSRLLSIRERTQDLVGEFSHYPIWGWKDPRNSLTLPFWKTLIPDLNVVICVRNPYDVFQSLKRRGYASSTFSYDLWLKYNRQLLAAADPGARIVTHFESYFHNPQSEVKRLVDFLGMDVSAEMIANACKTISVDLRHSHGNTLNLLDTRAPLELLQAYHELSYQAGYVYRTSLSPDKCKVLDLDSVRAVNSLIFERLAQKDEVLAQKDAVLAQKDAVLAQKDAVLAQKDAVLAQKDGEIARLYAERNHIFQSRSWRLIRIFQKVREFFIPPGSRREKLVLTFFEGLGKLGQLPSILRREGLRGLFLRVFNRVNKSLPSRVAPDTVETVYTDLLLTARGQARDEFVPPSKENISINEALVKLIAFYLPQFHPIPENDMWWGKGFTEWQNVSKAVPQFSGHYQPHLPGELGFYDLRLPEILAQQIELARKYGIYGFAFHYYWFNGKRLLEKPLELFMQSKEDFPFCVCWANENWTRRWDGQEDDLLIGQEHSPESDLRFIQDIAPILKDKRYIRINGRPLLIVYRANILPNVLETVALWREYCKSHDIGDPYLVAAQTFWFTDPREVGFDAAVEFPPHSVSMTNISHLLKFSNPEYQGMVFDYKEIIKKTTSLTQPEYKLYKTIFPSWDNEARKPGRGYTFAFSTPTLYKDWLVRTAKFTLQEQDPDKRLLFINAWNEWAEGAHLEPDRRYGYAYLQATADALKEISRMKVVVQKIANNKSGNLKGKHLEKQAQLSKTDPRMSAPIVIFQSGKVGSMSVFASLEKKYKELGISTPIYHAHILENIDQRIEFVTRVRANPTSTINKLLESKELRNQIDNDPEKPWNIITLVRDPVALKVSALFQLIDEYFPDWQQQFESGKLALSDMQKILLEKEEFQVSRLDEWFDKQLMPVWKVDVFSVPFAKEDGYQIYKPNARVNLIIIRLEDLNRVAGKSFHEFIGVDEFTIVNANVGGEKPYHKLYEQFKKMPIPEEYLEKAYNTRYARYFYTEKEIETFREGWLHPNSGNGE